MCALVFRCTVKGRHAGLPLQFIYHFHLTTNPLPNLKSYAIIIALNKEKRLQHVQKQPDENRSL